MKYYDVFNGDADGICALQQLRLETPQASQLVTGVKRDIALLNRVDAGSGDFVTVLDISLDKNREGLLRLLSTGVNIQYFDHHFAGEIPENDYFNAIINSSSDVCTSVLVNQYLNGKFSDWAVVGAYGDNLSIAAGQIGESLNYEQKTLLCQLGECMNYNAYGASLDDLHFTPVALFNLIRPYESPFEFIEKEANVFESLCDGYRQDMQKAENIKMMQVDEAHAVLLFPDEAWARRVSGVYANKLASENPNRAHALLTQRSDGGYLVSVRAPFSNKDGADLLCRRFPTGGGRKAAAGINNLPESMLNEFLQQFKRAYIQQ